MNVFKEILMTDDEHIVQTIRRQTEKGNADNISRTIAYQRFFQKHPEIRWSFLAAMVSRNAGYNMCDLEGYWYPKILSKEYRHDLFMTFERANWLIFQDAYPQLLLYHYSTKLGRPMFHLFERFHISNFMKGEWNSYWYSKDIERLTTSLIINEQNLIQTPVLEQPSYQKQVFESLLYKVQDLLRFSIVLFPACSGELYGASAINFRDLDERIILGKKLALILFSDDIFPAVYRFALHTEHTGSRHDYEQYSQEGNWRLTPYLRTTYPIITHNIHRQEQWDKTRRIKKKWFTGVNLTEDDRLTGWYKNKQRQLHAGIAIEKLFVLP